MRGSKERVQESIVSAAETDESTERDALRPSGVEFPPGAATRSCRACSRQVRQDFRFCPYCGKRQASPSEAKWRHSTGALVIAFALIGPFALPLLWSNPRYRPTTKVVVTVSVLVATILIVYALVLLSVRVLEQYKELLRTY